MRYFIRVPTIYLDRHYNNILRVAISLTRQLQCSTLGKTPICVDRNFLRCSFIFPLVIEIYSLKRNHLLLYDRKTDTACSTYIVEMT